MSAAEAARRPASAGRALKLWLALVVLIAAGAAIAWISVEPMRGETTESGIRFRTVKAGEGDFIQPVDGVMIEYEGRLDDGTVFDSSAGRGPTPMIAGQVIPGFAEALTKMQQGGSYRIRIPSELAYGSESPPGSPIPPNSDLTFDVQVVKVVPNAALMSPSPAAPQPGASPTSPSEASPQPQQ